MNTLFYVTVLLSGVLIQIILHLYVRNIRQNRVKSAKARRHKRILQLNLFCRQAINEEQLREELRRQRQRLARDLHDSVGSKLTYLIHSLDLMMLDISRKGQVTSRQQVENLSQCTRETMQILRETVWVMHQRDLTVQQFVDHLRDYLNKYLSIWSHLDHQLSTEGDLSIQLSSEQALNLFQIVQEAITNVLRHARASSLYIRIMTSSGEGLRLEILDDGRGFNPSENQQGIGLDSLRQRTNELGGHIVIQSVQYEPLYYEQKLSSRPLLTVSSDRLDWRTAVRVKIPLRRKNTTNAV